MSFRFTVLETSLNRAEFQLKCLRLLKRIAGLGLVVCGILLALGIGIVSGTLTDRGIVLAFIGIVCGAALIAFVVLLIATSADSTDRHWLASAVEKTEGRLLDRLSALLLLESRRGERPADSFAYRIARQAQQVLAPKPPASPFSSGGALAWFCAFLLATLGLFYLNNSYAPWTMLTVAKANPAPAKAAEQPLELGATLTNNVEPNRAWGEVRITDPGADLRVTKVDVVPLQIEAAANQPLKTVRWLSAVNGGEELPHDLSAPSDPKYALYQPTVYLDELNLADWDVLTYYAQADTQSNQTYASDVFFVEVRPFREDIMKMPGGGEGGKPYQAINDMSGLINRQQHIIRETYQHAQNPPADEAQLHQDRTKLSEAESDLGASVQHLYAKMATEMENQPIGEALDNLAKAQTELEGAASKLQENDLPAGQNKERGALSALVAARKTFQKAVSDNPSAFDQQPGEDQESSPVADSSKKLQRMAEFRNEARAAQEFLQKALEQQKGVEQQSRNASLSQYSHLSQEEHQLEQDLRNFADQHPNALKGTENQTSEAQRDLSSASNALQNHNSDARSATQKATRSLENLTDTAQRQALGEQLADAYRLKQMLDKQAQNLAANAKPDSKLDQKQLEQTAEDARQTVDQMKKLAEQEPTKNAFGQPLRDALNGNKKTELDANLQKLQRGENENAQRQAAGEASKGLQNLSKAFSQSQPKSLQMAQQSDSLKPAEADGLAKGMAELERLLKEMQEQGENQPSKEAEQKQGQQALADIQSGLRSQFGNNEQGNQLLAQLDQAINAEQGFEPGNVEKLLRELQKFSAEVSGKQDRQEDKPQLANINPAQLPPAYRGRIQKYFEKLSEDDGGVARK